MIEQARDILQKYWGYADFRHPQASVIRSIMQGNDTLALLPTGGGKSICYQIPALISDGKVLVISPLISLMQDQVQNLEQKGIMAKAIHSGLSSSMIEAILDNFVYGPLKILYVSPERLQSEDFLVRFRLANMAFIAVDEAHCISQWGHDFRPSYLKISILREIKPEIPVLALTATATSTIIDDISRQLDLKNPAVFKKSFERENLLLSVIKTDDKQEELLHILKNIKGSGIIYTRSRKACIRLSSWLSSRGILAIPYHGGMESAKRTEHQNKWMKSNTAVMIATNAFGMGIDKPDVRYVIHLDMPPSLEDYYQEAGRAGRDGKMSFAVSILNNADFSNLLKNFNLQYPELSEIAIIYQELCRYLGVAIGDGEGCEYYFDIDNFAMKNTLNISKVHNTLKILEKQEWFELSEGLKSPSQIMIVVHPQEIFELYKENDRRLELLVYLLRKHEGIYIEMIDINESQIARDLNIDLNHLQLILNALSFEGTVKYKQSSDLPKLLFLHNRYHPEFFGIDKQAYFSLKSAAQKRLEGIISYFSSNQCRQKMILEYFGESGSSCGRCDICKGSMQEDFSKDDIQDIMNFLSKNQHLNLKAFLRYWPYNKRLRIQYCLKYLESESILRMDDNGNLFLTKNNQN